MVVTVTATVATGNLAIGVGLGVLLAILLFVRRVAHVVTVRRHIQSDGGGAARDCAAPEAETMHAHYTCLLYTSRCV